MNFLKIILIKINNENINFIYFLFLFNAGIQLFLSSLLPFSLSADSYHYLGIAEQLNISNFYQNVNPENRSVGYPIFLYILGAKSFLGVTIVIFAQSIMSILLPVLVFIFLSQNNINSRIQASKVLSILASIIPYYHYMSSQIMTEVLFVFLLVLNLFYLENFFKKKDVRSFFYSITLILLAALVRPSAIVFFYIILIVIVIMFIFKFINFNKFYKIIFLFFLSFFIFSLQNTPQAKSFLTFIAWSLQVGPGFCDIKDKIKIEKIKNQTWAKIPDKNNYLVIKKSKKDMNGTEKNFIFKEKCFNFNNKGKFTEKYFSIIVDLLNKKEEPLREILTSTYNIAGSPDKPNPNYNNLSVEQIIKKVHEEYIYPLPYQHIWWRMSANIGLEETNKIIKSLIIELTLKKPQIWLENMKFMIKNINPFSVADNTNVISQSGKDMYFWRFIPSPYIDLNKQIVPHLFTINPEIYLQNIYSLEKMSGKIINNIYNKKVPIYVTAENYFIKKIKNLVLKDFGIGFVTTKILWELNFIFLYIAKLFVFLFIPIGAILYFIKKIVTKTKLDKNDYLGIYFAIFGYAGIFVSIIFFWDPRHIFMHFIAFFPTINILLNNLKKTT